MMIPASSTPPLNPLLISSLSELPLPPAFDPTADQAAAAPAKKTTVGQTLGFGGEAGKVMPSWMKLGKSGSEHTCSRRLEAVTDVDTCVQRSREYSGLSSLVEHCKMNITPILAS